MYLNLSRFNTKNNGVFGKLYGDDFTLYTVEKPWDNNEPFKSCIPAGEYKLMPHSSDKFGETWALVNEELGVSHVKTAGVLRYACLFHVANYPKDVEGCIGVGMTQSGNMVTNSRKAMKIFREKLGGAVGAVKSPMIPNEQHYIRIDWSEA